MTRPARLLLALALLALAASGVALSGAAFTDRHDEPASSLDAATLRLEARHPGATLLDATNLRPGLERTGRVTLENAGTATADLRLGAAGETGAPLAAALRLVLRECSTAACGEPTRVWSGAPSELDAEDLGRIGPGASRTYEVTLAWPAENGDPTLQGATAGFELRWTLVAGEAA